MMHQWNLERAHICVLFFLHMQILYISHSICTTYAVQRRILYFNYFCIFLQPMNPLPSFFSVEKQQRCFRWPQNPPKKKVPTPAAAVCISRGVARGSGGWVSQPVWPTPAFGECLPKLAWFCYVWFLVVVCKPTLEVSKVKWWLCFPCVNLVGVV